MWTATRLAVIAGLLIAVVYGEVAVSPFVADDFNHVARSVGAGRLDVLAGSLTGPWTGHGPPFHYRPLAIALFTLDGALWGTWAPGWHLLNLAVLLVTGMALAALTARWARRMGLDGARARGAGAVACLLFVAFPAQIQAWAWISHRGGPLALMLSLASLAWFLGGRRWLSLLAFGLALTAKETAAVVPLLILLAAGAETRRWRATLAGLVPHLLLLAGYLGARVAMFGTPGTGAGALAAGPLAMASYAAGNLSVLASTLVAPVAAELVGPLAAPATLLCVALVAAPMIVLLAAERAAGAAWLARTFLFAAALGGVLLGPAMLVSLDAASLNNSRFVPAVAAPFCAALGLLFARLGPRRRARLWSAALIVTWTGVAVIQAGSWALAARDLAALQRELPAAVDDHVLYTVLLDLPETGPGVFATRNAFTSMFSPPHSERTHAINELTTGELDMLRRLPEYAGLFDRPWLIVPGQGGAVATGGGPWSALARRFSTWRRLAPSEPLRLQPFSGPRLAAGSLVSLVPGRDEVSLGEGYDPSSVGAVVVHLAAGVGATGRVTLRWRGDRGAGSVERAGDGAQAVLFPLDADLAWLTGGAVRSLAVEAPVPVQALQLLPTLPALELRSPAPDSALSVEVPPSFVFAAPPGARRFRLRVALGRQALLSDEFVRGELSTVDGDLLAIPFDGTAVGPRRTRLDWSAMRAVLDAGQPVAWFLEVLDPAFDPPRAVARSPLGRFR